MANINDSYFDGYYKDIWRRIIPEQLTIKEVDFMISYFGLKPGSKVLDLMCGYGRHAIALARRGIEVTAVDNLNDYIVEIKKVSENEGLLIHVIKTNVLNFKSDQVFDLVICMGNSLNFFDPDEAEELLRKISLQLKPQGHLLLNTWSISEIALPNFKNQSSSTIDEVKYITKSRLLYNPTRIQTESVIIGKDSRPEIKTAIDYIFSIPEITIMLEKAGLSLKEIYSIPGKKKFSEGEPRAYIICEKFEA